jgi:REP element-mobilizing transposase RayT
MGYPRSMTIAPATAGFYHCISRCVRRAWLCGDDPLSGRNFDHRRGWVEQRLLDLAQSFAVELYAWAVMSNHTHVVLRVDPDVAATWTDIEVATRWTRLARTLDADPLPVHARTQALLQQPARLAIIRERLGNVSWFMRFLNECIARQANAEDDCTGRFWEGRFRCQALLDEQAVLACMAYVDLNPIRAGIAADLTDSNFTSIQRRLRALEARPAAASDMLAPLAGGTAPTGPQITVDGYIDLVRWSAGYNRGGAGAVVEAHLPAALVPTRGSPDWWVRCVARIERVFGCAVGSATALRDFATATGRKVLRGI